MVKTITPLILIFLIGIASVQAMSLANTLANNEAMPKNFVENSVNESMADILLETPYKGFYQFESTVRNSKIYFNQVETQQSFPDERWMDIANEIANLVQMPAYSTGSRIVPRATAYVVFYDASISGLDDANIIYLPTSAYARPNVVAVLLIKHDNYSGARDALGARTRSAHQNTDRILFFELAL